MFVILLEIVGRAGLAREGREAPGSPGRLRSIAIV